MDDAFACGDAQYAFHAADVFFQLILQGCIIAFFFFKLKFGGIKKNKQIKMKLKSKCLREAFV